MRLIFLFNYFLSKNDFLGKYIPHPLNSLELKSVFSFLTKSDVLNYLRALSLH